MKYEFIVAGRNTRYSFVPEMDATGKLYWRSYTPFWWGVTRGLIDGLIQDYIWEGRVLDPDIRIAIEQLALPETPPKKEVIVIEYRDCNEGGVSSGLFDSSEDSDCEDDMGITGLRWNEGVLEYRLGCCEWIVVPGKASQSTVPPDEGSIDNDGGSDGDSPLPPHTIYTTPDLKRCAAAESIVLSLRMGLGVSVGIHDTFEIELSAVGWATAAIAYVQSLAFPPIIFGIGIASSIILGLMELVFGDVGWDDLGELYETDSFWREAACLVSDELIGITTIGDAEYRKAVTVINSLAGGSEDDRADVARVLRKLPLSWLRQHALVYYPTIRCQCEELTVPPANTDIARASVGAYRLINGTPYTDYETLKTEPLMGTVMGAGKWRFEEQDRVLVNGDTAESITMRCIPVVEFANDKIVRIDKITVYINAPYTPISWLNTGSGIAVDGYYGSEASPEFINLYNGQQEEAGADAPQIIDISNNADNTVKALAIPLQCVVQSQPIGTQVSMYVTLTLSGNVEIDGVDYPFNLERPPFGVADI